MRKNPILERLGQDTVQFAEELSSASATPDLREVIAQEVAKRGHRSSQLEVLEYQPGADESAQRLMRDWHLLFFARAGAGEMQKLRQALQEERLRDEHLMKQVRQIQAQYRQYQALSTSNVTTSLEAEAVI